MTDKKDPPSLRLNKGHKEDMLNAVMKRWEEANPRPVCSVYEIKFRRFHELYKDDPTAPVGTQSYRINYSRFLQAQKEASKAVKKLSPLTKNMLNLRVTYSLEWAIPSPTDSGGFTWSTPSFYLPAELAKELKISFSHTAELQIGQFHHELETQWAKYIKTRAPKDGSSCAEGTVIRYLEVAVFFNPSTCTPEFEVDASFENDVEITRALRKSRKWENLRDQLMEETRDYLDQFSTTKQIRDQWPEMVEYLPPHLADPARVIQFPALVKSRLNERLGL